MPEIRQNPATKEWVIVASERAHRPEQFRHDTDATVDILPEWDARCPFCPGNEAASEEVTRWNGDDGAWRLRVVRNKYPALEPEGARARRGEGFFRSVSGVGFHEVVVESPTHNSCPALETPLTLQRTLTAFRERGRAFREDHRIEHVTYFKNHGARAGTSMVHPHCQIIALPVVPHDIRARAVEARRYLDDNGDCVICAMVRAELQAQERLVAISERFVAFIPYAAYSPFHIWIVPRLHGGSFLDSNDACLEDLGQVLWGVLRRLYVGLNDPDYNFVVRSAPLKALGMDFEHWYVSVVARVNLAAGFELGSGMFINPSLPETNAAFLRGVPLD